MASFRFRSHSHFVASSDGTTLQVYELTEPAIHPSSIRKAHWKEVATINTGPKEVNKEEDDDESEGSRNNKPYDGLLFLDGHGKIDGRKALTTLAQHLKELHLLVSPIGYCYQEVSELGTYFDYGIHYLRLNDLFSWPLHGVGLVKANMWSRLDLNYMNPSSNSASGGSGNIRQDSQNRNSRMISKEKYAELEKLMKKRNEELEKLKEEMDEVNESKEEELQKLKRADKEQQKQLRKKDNELRILKSEKEELETVNEESEKVNKANEEELKKLRKKQHHEDAKAAKIAELEKAKEEMEDAMEAKDEEVRKIKKEKDEELRKMTKKMKQHHEEDANATRIAELERVKEEMHEIIKTKDDELRVLKNKKKDEDDDNNNNNKNYSEEKSKRIEELETKLKAEKTKNEELERCQKSSSWTVLPSTKYLYEQVLSESGKQRYLNTRRRVLPESFSCESVNFLPNMVSNSPRLGETLGDMLSPGVMVVDEESDYHTEWPTLQYLVVCVGQGRAQDFDKNDWWYLKTTHPEGGLTMLVYYDGDGSCSRISSSYDASIPLPYSKHAVVYSYPSMFSFFNLHPYGVRLGFTYRA